MQKNDLRESSRTDLAVGAAQATGSDSRAVGRQVAATARRRMGGNATPGWAIAFCGGHHDGRSFLEGLRDEVGGIPIVGGAAVGIVAAENIGYGGTESAVAILPAEAGKPTILCESMDDGGERAAGERLGRRIAGNAAEGASVLLFFDSVRSTVPPSLHAGSHLIDGVYAGIGSTSFRIAGGGTLADFGLTESFLFDGQAVCRHVAVAIVLPSSLRIHTQALRACLPVSSFMTITRIDGAIVHEIDGQSAVAALERIAGGPIDSERARDLELRVLLGEQHGDLLGPADGANYVNRLIVAIDPDAGTLTLFEPDFKTGSRVQVMTRDNRLMFESARQGTEALVAQVADRNCLLGLYVDCAGRAGMLCGIDEEEARVVTEAVDGAFPLVGFYSGVEIAPLLGRSRPLDLTGVLVALCLEGRP